MEAPPMYAKTNTIISNGRKWNSINSKNLILEEVPGVGTNFSAEPAGAKYMECSMIMAIGRMLTIHKKSMSTQVWRYAFLGVSIRDPNMGIFMSVCLST